MNGRKIALIALASLVVSAPSVSHAHVAANPEILGDLGIREGDIVGSTDTADPDIFIINEWGYKRLFLSPVIFAFYGHLRYDGVRRFPDTVIASMPVSALFRNCETGDRRVYALEVTSEDDALLRWVDISGEAAVAEDPDFFKRIFCINEREFAWYRKGASYTALSQVPVYERAPAYRNPDATGLGLTLPDGFRIAPFAARLGPVRFMAFSPDGILFASMPSAAGLYGGSGLRDGKVYALPDRNGDGTADEARTVLSGLRLPHGLAFHGGFLYVAEEGTVARYPYRGGGVLGDREVIATLPSGGSHVSRTITFGRDGNMYVSVGSFCNNCTTGTEGTAAIWEFNADGSGSRVYARGVRNAVGLAVHPQTGALWATENGRDFLGDDLPPDEVNIIRNGGHYGWPYCYGRRVTDPAYPDYDCTVTVPSVHGTQAHSAPLGLAFVPGRGFPASWAGDIVVARHGSWNRTRPVGYDVIRLDVSGETVVLEEPFITGWLKPDGRKSGRPVDVVFGADGALYVSDDGADMIYRVTYGQ
ncbi:MAG TPA: sorbosone dehydrogenase family protein [Candidatus Paceibacterota bacterium]|nr:sorbosone dehydrogenase family protein [Candidatus Paceibacterota bacterium]